MVLMSSAAVSGGASGGAPGGKAPDDGVVVGAGSTAPAGAGVEEGGGVAAGAAAPVVASVFLSAPFRSASCRVSPTASCSILAGSTTTSGSMPLAWIERPEGV